MRLHVLSDLHTEFATFTPPRTDADVVIIAGDVHVGRNGRSWIRSNFQTQPVIYVLGNHEFYRDALPKLTQELERESDGSHIHVLENRCVELEGYVFLGCTLWTDFQLGNNFIEAQSTAEEIMSDYHLIRVTPEYRKLRARDTAKLHAASVAWLKSNASRYDPVRTVIVTHHAPSPRSIPSCFDGNILNAAFASNLEPFIAQLGVALWIHGHTHHCVDYRLGETRVLSNQRGYPDALVKGFDPGLSVDV
jgi:Icc-related predicted phosphoesterase